MKTTKIKRKGDADGKSKDATYMEREEEGLHPRLDETRRDRWYWEGLECRKTFRR